MPGTTSEVSRVQAPPVAMPAGGYSSTVTGAAINAISPMLTAPALVPRRGATLKVLASAGASATLKARVSPMVHPVWPLILCSSWKVTPPSEEDDRIHAVGACVAASDRHCTV